MARGLELISIAVQGRHIVGQAFQVAFGLDPPEAAAGAAFMVGSVSQVMYGGRDGGGVAREGGESEGPFWVEREAVGVVEGGLVCRGGGGCFMVAVVAWAV